MLPTNYYILEQAIKGAKLRNELSVILSYIEDDKYLSDQDKKDLRLALYRKLQFTY